MRRPTSEELLQAQLNRPESEISAAPNAFDAVPASYPQMTTLDLVGLLGLIPTMLGGKGGGVARGAQRPPRVGGPGRGAQLPPSDTASIPMTQKAAGGAPRIFKPKPFASISDDLTSAYKQYRAGAGEQAVSYQDWAGQLESSMNQFAQGMALPKPVPPPPPTGKLAPSDSERAVRSAAGRADSETAALLKRDRMETRFKGQLLGLPDEANWVAAAKAGDPQALEVITSRAEQMSNRISKRYARGSKQGQESIISPEEMKAEARKVVLESLNTFDPANPEKASFGTYLYKNIQNRSYNYALESGFGTELPDKMRRAMAYLNRYDAETQKRNVVSPTRTGEVRPPELASIHMKSMEGRSMAPETIRELRGRLQQPTKLSLSSMVDKEGREAIPGGLHQYLTDRRYSPAQGSAELQMLVSQLPAKQRQAVEAYLAEGTGTGEEGTTGFREVGKRQGISHEMARKNLQGAIEGLRQQYRPAEKPAEPERPILTEEKWRAAMTKLDAWKKLGQISGGSNIGEMSSVPTLNFGPDLKRISGQLSGQAGGQPRYASEIPRSMIEPTTTAATDKPGRDFFFGNPAEDFHPGVAEKPNISLQADTYTKLRSLINAMVPYYRGGRQ